MATTVTVTSKREHTATDAGRDGSLKGLVLSGGKGSRLRPFTYTNAKQLVPIADKPVIFYTIEQLVEAGITEIGIVVGDTGDQVAAAIGDGSQFCARTTFIQQHAPLGIAHAVATARDFLGDSPFVLYLGDNFVMGGIQSYVDKFTANGSCSQILLHPVANPEAFGIAEMSAGRVTRIVEKPRNAQSNLAVVGIYMFDRAVHDVIGRDTAIVNSYVGPNTSIDARCRIVGCRIEDSIVMEDSCLERLHWPVAKSMIGRFVELHGGHNADGLYSLTLGDYSRIEMPDG